MVVFVCDLTLKEIHTAPSSSVCYRRSQYCGLVAAAPASGTKASLKPDRPPPGNPVSIDTGIQDDKESN